MMKEMRDYLMSNYYTSEIYLTLTKDFNAKLQNLDGSPKKCFYATYMIGSNIVVSHKNGQPIFKLAINGATGKSCKSLRSLCDKLHSIINDPKDKRDKQYNKVTDMRTIAKLKGLIKSLESGESLSKAAKLVNLDYTTAKMFKNNELGITEKDLV